MQSHAIWETPAESREPSRWLGEGEVTTLAGGGSVDQGPVPRRPRAAQRRLGAGLSLGHCSVLEMRGRSLQKTRRLMEVAGREAWGVQREECID